MLRVLQRREAAILGEVRSRWRGRKDEKEPGQRQPDFDACTSFSTMPVIVPLQMSGGAAWINFILGGGILAAMGGAAYYQILKERERLGKPHWCWTCSLAAFCFQPSGLCSSEKHRYGANRRGMGAH